MLPQAEERARVESEHQLRCQARMHPSDPGDREQHKYHVRLGRESNDFIKAGVWVGPSRRRARRRQRKREQVMLDAVSGPHDARE